MFAALNDEEEEQVQALAEQPPQPQKPVKVFTLEDMVNEQKEVERKMALGMSWYDIFMREDEEKRWREEAKFGKSDDWTDITNKKVKNVSAPKKVRAHGRR